MKLSEVIEKLQTALNEHGDIEAHWAWAYDGSGGLSIEVLEGNDGTKDLYFQSGE